MSVAEQTPADVQRKMAAFLRYYKRRDVQEAIVRHAQNREVSPRYGEGFGRRPDMLMTPADVRDFATRKTTSFHASEERWENPMQIQTGMPRKELDGIRTGWDLVLDIDAPDWEISRLTAFLFVQALRHYGISAISVKFSGNKGWHIGVPFESFPLTIVGPDGKETQTKDLFPELPRAIATHLIATIGDPTNGLITITDDEIRFGRAGDTQVTTSLATLAKKVGKTPKEILTTFCPACKRSVARAQEQHALCCINPNCLYRPPERYTHEEKELVDDAKRRCPRCRHVMEFTDLSKSKPCPHDPRSYQVRFDITQVVAVDTVLLASRHLYRMAYSLHEKSGLASVVIDSDGILSFKKSDADPTKISLERTFLDPTVAIPGEAARLAREAWSVVEQQAQKPERIAEFELVEDAVPEELFPPCITAILKGLPDGKKRAMFALTNFLTVVGWSPAMIEERIHKWNEANPEPLREVIVKGHLRTLAGKKDRIPPPNCKSFYQDLGVCKPDEFCGTIRNPAQYAVRKAKLGKPKGRAKKPDKPAPAPAPDA